MLSEDTRTLLLTYLLPRHANRAALLGALIGEEGLPEGEISRFYAQLQAGETLSERDMLRLLAHLLLLQECDIGGLLSALAASRRPGLRFLLQGAFCRLYRWLFWE